MSFLLFVKSPLGHLHAASVMSECVEEMLLEDVLVEPVDDRDVGGLVPAALATPLLQHHLPARVQPGQLNSGLNKGESKISLFRV